MTSRVLFIGIFTVLLNCSTAFSDFVNVSIDGAFSDWAGVAAFDTDALDNVGNVDFQSLYLANDDDFLYVRVTLHAAANPHTFNENYFFDTDANTGTGFNAFGSGLVGSEILVQGAGTFQEANGGFNDGASIADSQVIQSPFNTAGTDFEFRISRTTTGSVAPFLGVQLFSGSQVGVLIATDVGGDRIGGGNLYTFSSAVPEPSTSILLFSGLLSLFVVIRRRGGFQAS